MKLEQLVDWSFSVFDKLDPNQKYKLAFSGGKDSHVLLGVYIAWVNSRVRDLDLKVVFSDTLLETQALYKLINETESHCNELGIDFLRTKPDQNSNYWVKQFGYGYPVPNHRIRWCTSYLKIDPISKLKGIVLAGSHVGESLKRDQRLKTCGSTECGIDKVKKKIEPLAIWSNCNVWDWIALEGEKYLYKGSVELLHETYDISEGDNGSLRMGCFMCPVIARSTTLNSFTKGATPLLGLQIRDLLDQLGDEPRIYSVKKNKRGEQIRGAILVDSRIKFWSKLKPLLPELITNGWIDQLTIDLVEDMLIRRCYPPSYKEEWIKQQEPIAASWKQDK